MGVGEDVFRGHTFFVRLNLSCLLLTSISFLFVVFESYVSSLLSFMFFFLTQVHPPDPYGLTRTVFWSGERRGLGVPRGPLGDGAEVRGSHGSEVLRERKG